VGVRDVSFIEGLEPRYLFAQLTIAQENALPGVPPSQWGLVGNGDTTIQGFATQFSRNVGQTIQFKVDDQTLAPFHIDIYRLGYYGGNGARLVTTIADANTTERQQPAPLTDNTGLIDCGNWSVSASWSIPADATSGVYIARVVREDNQGASHIPFVVRNDASTSNVLFQTSDTTWQAYNSYGGKSLYYPDRDHRAFKVSYNRPFNNRGSGQPNNFIFATEYPAIRFMEANGYDVSYFSGADTDRFGSEILQHKIFASVGHDEYWSGTQRANVLAARNAGVNLTFLSGNEIYWKTRWENSIDGSGTAYRTLVCYKETHAGGKIDPTSTWTGTWRDTSFSPPWDGGNPENGLSGTIYQMDAYREDPITVSSDQGKLRFWRNTSLASIPSGQTVTFDSGLLGYEWDTDWDNGFRPAGLMDLSSSSFTTSNQKLIDMGNNTGAGTVVHSLTLYRASSGAMVFAAGSAQWSWGFDSNHDDPLGVGLAADVRIKQATVNLFADMGVQPTTLQAGLVAASASTDATAPTVAITTSSGAVDPGKPVIITGTASDVGGAVSGIEVSTDGGTTWHPATGTTSWTYSFVPNTFANVSVRARSIDDSGNISANSSPITLTMQQTAAVSVFSTLAAPLNTDAQDVGGVELGFRFRSDVAGFISGLRFYKASANTGTHIGSLWSNGGALLAQGTFSGETASGWQTLTFGSPVAISANTTYVASYHTDVGHYSGDNWYFKQSGTGNGPLHALQDGVDGASGVFRYAASPAFPNGTFRSTNYWVDAIFTQNIDTTAPTVSSTSPAANATNVAVNSTVAITFSEDVQSGSIAFTLKDSNNNTVAGSLSYNSGTHIATFTPTSSLSGLMTYTARLSDVQDIAGNHIAAPVVWSFTTIDNTPPTVTAHTPASNATNVALSSTVTITFSEDVQSGSISFTLKDAGNNTVAGSLSYNSGTHVATFTPTAPLGDSMTYSATLSDVQDIAGNHIAAPVSWSFTTVDTTAPTITSKSPAANAVNVALNSAVTFTFSEPVNAGSITFTLKDAGNNTVPGTLSYDSPSRTATFTPTSALADSSAYTATVSDAADPSGNHLASPLSWNFSTVDTTAPTITTHSPASNAVDVPIATAITFTFSEAVQAGSITFTLKDGANNPIPGNLSYDGPSRTATFTPTSSLAGSTSFTATVTDAQDLEGNHIAAPVAWSFTTIDATPPTITSHTPGSSASGIAPSSTVSVTFSEPVQSGTISIVLTDPQNNVIAGSISYDSGTQTATFTPNAALLSFTTYTVSVSGAQDAVGNTMSNVSWSFTTADVVAPGAALGSTTPVAGTSSFDFTVTYTDNGTGIDATSFDDNDITVSGPNGFSANATFISVDTPGNGATRIVTYRISAPGGLWNLADNGLYTVTQNANQVRDVAGNYRPAGTVGTFTAAVDFAYQIGSTVYADFDGNNHPITLTNGGDVTASENGVTLNFSGVTSVMVNGTSSADVLDFNGPIVPAVSFLGGAGGDTLNVNAGTYTFPADASATTTDLSVNVSGTANVVFNASQHLKSLILSDSAVASLTAAGNRYLQLSNLSIAPAAKLDLNDNDFILAYTGAAPFSTMFNYVETGFRVTPDPSATGIISTTGQNLNGLTILVLFDNALFNSTEWPIGSGHTVPAHAIIGKYTWFGDLNLDGQVTGDDYAVIDSNLGTTPVVGRGWIDGDANLDGIVTGDDYAVIDSNLGNGQGNPLAPAASSAIVFAPTAPAQDGTTSVRRDVLDDSQPAV